MDFLSWFVPVMIGAAIFALVSASRRKGGGDSDGAEVVGGEPSRPEETAGDGGSDQRSIYEIADALGPIYQTCARPDDMRGHPDFAAGVRRFRSAQFSAADLGAYFAGDNAIFALLAVAALGERDDAAEAHDRVLSCIGTVAPWPLHFALEYLADTVPVGKSLIGPVLGHTVDYLENRQVRISLEGFIVERLTCGEVPEFGDALAGANPDNLRVLWSFVNGLGAESSEPVARALQDWSDRHIDRAFLESFGTVWDGAPANLLDEIVDHEALTAATDTAVEALTATQARSVILVGEPGVGKATLAFKVAATLVDQGWTIFQAGNADLIAGQSWIGQLEERVRNLLVQLGGRRRILWIVPDIHHLAMAGRHRYGPVSVLDTVIRPIESGEIKVLGITTLASHERLLRHKPGVETAFMPIKVGAMAPARARRLALEWLDRATGPRDGNRAIVDEAAALASQYLSDKAAPGNLLDLLRLAVQRVAGDRARDDPVVGFDDLVKTLAEATGLPIALLDERRQIDIAGLRRTFNARVLGQPEAVDCLVERVAMVKAGLTDPNRPVGVFLFAGPTGTGKTEMAKTLAAWLFGSPDRMIRLDMSELQTPEDLERILGDGPEAGSDTLVGRIREQPFSVVLLDEFEKAHARVWDLFLQVFDDGRLTDRAGQTADFRHAIIILTTNLGSTIPTGVSLGFRSGSDSFDPGSVIRAVEDAFRREFVNRLDRVVVFRPLTRELMRAILEKELASILERRGLRSRPWAIEWDAAAIDFLLDEGFTRDLGARPLRRAVERHLLSPLAMTIVNHQAPEGDQFLFVTRDGPQLKVEFVDPDAPTADAAAAAPGGAKEPAARSLAAIALEPHGSAGEIAFLHERFEALSALVGDELWRARKAEGIALMQDPGFWDAAGRFAVLDAIERSDRIEHAVSRAGSLLARLEGSSGSGRDRYPIDLVGVLGRSLILLETAADDVANGRPGDAFLMVGAGHAKETGIAEAEAFAAEIAAMYRAWAQRRRMKLQVLDEAAADGAGGFRFLAAVRGFAAHTILAREHGLHVLESRASEARSYDRHIAIVRVAPEPVDLGALAGAMLRAEAERAVGRADEAGLRIARRYRKVPSPLVRDSVAGWRTGRIDQVMGGDFDLIE